MVFWKLLVLAGLWCCLSTEGLVKSNLASFVAVLPEILSNLLSLSLTSASDGILGRDLLLLFSLFQS